MATTLLVATKPQRAVVNALYQDYHYDIMIEIGELDQHCERKPVNTDHLDKFWKDPDHFPYLIMEDNKIIGFSLLRRYPSDKQWMDVDQFYIVKKYRRKNMGKEAVRISLVQFPGPWIVRVITKNKPGLAFWTKTLTELSDNQFARKIEKYDNKPMVFFRFKI